mmetsp:Transcript_9538/g.10588  ORF Transcript_9538/g.10588 Transcript_9538/m.10588 type:complete len:127 (-) Transcript_9538:331-711(-)
MITNESKVIDWDEAMEQVGDDEEFLRELLGDLRQETDGQVKKISEIIATPCDSPFHLIMRAAHVIKGAASNLMCEQLRSTAMALEQDAKVANENPEESNIIKVKEDFLQLEKANNEYHAYLKTIGV